MREWAEVQSQGILDAVPDAILGVDEDRRIALVNRNAERLFGYDRAEMLGQSVELLLPGAFRLFARGERSVSRRVRDPVCVGSALAGRRKDGSEFPAEASFGAVRGGEVTVVVATVRDVTDRYIAGMESDLVKAHAEREELEARLEQAQRLESLGQLAGGVAHDFNNLLAVIVNYAAFVAEEIELAAVADPDRWHSVARDVQQIQRATDRGIALTHQLLAFGRREVVRPKVLSLNTVVRDVEQLLRRSLGEHVRLVTSLAPGLWPVIADPGQMEQVLVNLAVNARDAMPSGGILTVDTANVVLVERVEGARPSLLPGRYVRTRVQDTGMGMPKDVAAHAFEPFFTTKPKGEGTGLGLATVYGIVKQAGGDVRIHSEQGVGSTFHVLLPATDEADPQPEEDSPEIARLGQGETILVVEDEPAIRDVTRRILGRRGYQVLMAATGAEALVIAAEHDGAIELLMTDVIMPKMQGKEVAERLRVARPAMKVLFISGYARPVLANSGTLDPGVVLLEKPFSESTLLTAVRQVLDEPPAARQG
jgi:PAS domain S-box-containing protein